MELNFAACMCVVLMVSVYTRIISACQCATRHPQQHFCESDFVIRVRVLEKLYEPVNGGPAVRSSDAAPSKHHMSQETILDDAIKTKLPTSKPPTGFDLLSGSPRLRMAERPQQQPQQYVAENDDNENWNPWQYKLSYRVLVEKVYKGENEVKRKTKVKLVSSADSGICGMTKMDEKKKYLVTGMFTDKGLTVQLCNWVVEHSEITKRQRTGLKHLYKKYCDECTIKPGVIFWPPEAKEKDVCTYNPYLLYDDDCEGKHSACIRRPDGTCEWSQNSRMRRCEKRRSYPLDDTSQFAGARVGVL